MNSFSLLFIALVGWTLFPSNCLGQGHVEFFGKIRDKETGKCLREAKVRVVDLQDTGRTTLQQADRRGTYRFSLDYDAWYLLRFMAPGYVSKGMAVDLRGIPLSQREAGFNMSIDAALLERLDSVDYGIVEEFPFGMAVYDPALNNIVWDMDYTTRQRKDQELVMKEHLARRNVVRARRRGR